MNETITTKEAIENAIKELGITMTTEFIPFSKSRNKKEKNPNLNWVVEILRNGKAVLKTDFSIGMAYCPSYKQWRMTVDTFNAVKKECETGRAGRVSSVHTGPAINPELADVLHILMMEAESIDYPTFESWADTFGYDKDSRKGEAIYRVSLEIALKMRAGFGEAGLATLRDAFQAY